MNRELFKYVTLFRGSPVITKWPRPVLRRSSGLWVCHAPDDDTLIGSGVSADIAYAVWAGRFTTFLVRPRLGLWNRKSCRQWVARGCPMIATIYCIDGRYRRPVGYRYGTDELIFQG